jgi:DNA-binding IclR family transcriptional regulator
MPTGDAASSTMRSLDRAIDVLEVLDASTHPLRLAEIARRVGLHISTTQRILVALEARGRVEHDESGYRAGLALLFGAHAYLESSPLVRTARPVVQELADATDLTASLFARSGTSRAVVVRVEGRTPMRYVLPTGERLPLTRGAGKVIAAYLEDDELAKAVAADAAAPAVDPGSPSEEALDDVLASIRSRGWLHTREDRTHGVASIAAPILARDGTCLAGVQVAGSLTDLDTSREAELVAEVLQAARGIAARLG